MPSVDGNLALASFPNAAPAPAAQPDVLSPLVAQLIERLNRVDAQIARLSEAMTGGSGREDAMLAMIAQTAETQSDADERLADVLSTVAAAFARLPAPAPVAARPVHQPAFFAPPSAAPAAGPRPNAAPETPRPAPRFAVDYAALHEAAARNSRPRAANGGSTLPTPPLNE